MEDPGSGLITGLPPGHTLRADEDTDFVPFSPQAEHSAVIEHMARKAGAA